MSTTPQKQENLASKQKPLPSSSLSTKQQPHDPALPFQAIGQSEQIHLLHNANIQMAQRQAIAKQIGRNHGNQHIARLIKPQLKLSSSLQRTPSNQASEQSPTTETSSLEPSDLEEQIIPVPETAKNQLQNASSNSNQTTNEEKPAVPEQAKIKAPSRFKFELLPPKLQLRLLDELNFTATVSSAYLSWQHEQLQLNSGYKYGGSITAGATYNFGPSALSGQVDYDPRTNQGVAGLNYKHGLWNAGVQGGTDGSVGGSLSYGQKLPPMASEFGDSMRAGETGFRNTLPDAPGVLDDPSTLPSFISKHTEKGEDGKSNIGKVVKAGKDIGRVVDLREQDTSKINWGFYLNFNRTPTNNFQITGGVGISFKRDEQAQASHIARKHTSTPLSHSNLIQRGKKSKDSEEQVSNEDAPAVGIAGGENLTPSDQTEMASGYTERSDGQFNTPDKRVITREQALAESQLIRSEGIFMGAYLSRYTTLKEKFSLSVAELDALSKKAGFMKQFKTGDVVLRMMSAEDSAGIAKITDSNYSHSGIIQVVSGQVWVLDSYPGRKKDATATGEIGEDSSKLIRFEAFFGDHGKDVITQGIVLRMTNLSRQVRQAIDRLISQYDTEVTTFDREFKVDNGEDALYCSELVWRILVEAGAPRLPENEYDFTVENVDVLIQQLEGVIVFQQSQGADTTEAEAKLEKLRGIKQQFEAFSTQELYSPGTLERMDGLESVTGFTRAGNIEGTFDLIIVKGTVSDSFWDTPDPYVALQGGLFSNEETSVKDDTTSPSWNETLTTVSYEQLQDVTLKMKDSDTLFDDDLATFSADLRPVRPKGQTFELTESDATLTVKVKGVDEGKETGAFGPQAPRG